jgi:RNA polymerase sigma-70 factor (ECF subfamily)
MSPTIGLCRPTGDWTGSARPDRPEESAVVGPQELKPGRTDIVVSDLPRNAEDRRLYDEYLLEQIVTGNRLAYTIFFDRHAPRVLGILTRSLRHRADAEDVLQETFHQVWRTAARYAPERSSPEVWLMLIARSRLLDYIRRKRPDATGSLMQTEAPAFDPLANLTKRESAENVHLALAKLPSEQRTAILLSYFTGLTHQEIAEQQAIPLGTAKTRILLGIRSLRKLLAVADEATP